MDNKRRHSRAAILTWCYQGEINYGQIFQCYAMQTVVKRLGFNPVVIRYRRRTTGESRWGNRTWGILTDLYELWYRLKKVEHKIDLRIIRFICFIKDNILLSKQCYTKEQVEKVCGGCDILFCGSDQIWNPLCFDDVYFLNFGTKQQKRIAYAPSGIWKDNGQPDEFYEEVGRYISRFNVVTVREKESKEILNKYTEQRIRDVVDPTLLLSQEEWNQAAAGVPEKEAYIFCYFLGRIRAHKLLLKKIMKDLGVKKVLFITVGEYAEENNLSAEEEFIPVNNAGPAEFITLVRYAQAICTDSFHGIAFSVIYQKQFYIFRRNTLHRHPGANMARQENLLLQLGIRENRVVTCGRDLAGMMPVNYQNVRTDRLWEEVKDMMEECLHDR